MRALTLRQPWASIVVRGAKQIETLAFSTSYRGLIAIHASRTFDPAQWRLSDSVPFAAALGGIDLHKTLGKVIGTVELVDCVPVEEIADRVMAQERAFGTFEAGRWAWVLRNPRIRIPINACGQLGLWEWAPPKGWEEL